MNPYSLSLIENSFGIKNSFDLFQLFVLWKVFGVKIFLLSLAPQDDRNIVVLAVGQIRKLTRKIHLGFSDDLLASSCAGQV